MLATEGGGEYWHRSNGSLPWESVFDNTVATMALLTIGPDLHHRNNG